MLTLAKEEFRGRERLCAVRQTKAPTMSWEFDIKEYNDFEAFVRKIAEAWAIAETEESGLHITVHEEDLSDF